MRWPNDDRPSNHRHRSALPGDHAQHRINRLGRARRTSRNTVLDFAQILVVGNKEIEFEEVLGRIRDDQVVIDLVRVAPSEIGGGRYSGICW
jgi:hypothetical protein